MELSSERATHLVRLHLDNDEGTYYEVRRLVAEAIAEATPSDLSVEIVGAKIALQRAQQQAVAGALEGLVEDLIYGSEDFDVVGAGDLSLLGLDLVGAALGAVDFDELAADYLATADDEL